jgi:hypothetical protein
MFGLEKERDNAKDLLLFSVCLSRRHRMQTKADEI